MTLKSRVVLERIQYEGSFRQLMDKYYAHVSFGKTPMYPLFGKQIWNQMDDAMQKFASRVLARKDTPTIDQVIGPLLDEFPMRLMEEPQPSSRLKVWQFMVPPGTKKVQKRDEHGRFMKGFDYRPIDCGISPIVRVDYK